MGTSTVAVIGGGYGGAKLARLLDDVADVTLVEPKDAFVHASACLRAAVDASWDERVFHDYDGLLRNGRVLRGWAQRVTPTEVHVSDGTVLTPDYLVLATGAAYPYPAKLLEHQVQVARGRMARTRDGLGKADRVLVVGAGAVGLELAGELVSAYPHLKVTVTDIAEDILGVGDYLPELRAAVRADLEARGVDFVLGSPLGYLPSVDVGTYWPFTVATAAGVEIEAQMWFRCYGSRPVSDYLTGPLAAARNGLGQILVEENLSVVGHPTVYALGDVTDVKEAKRATAAIAHAEVVAANIRAAILGGGTAATYSTPPDRIVLALGPDAGASQVIEPDGTRRVLGAAETAAIKDADLYWVSATELFGR